MRGWTIALAALAWVALFNSSALAIQQWSQPIVIHDQKCKRFAATPVRAAQNARGDLLVAWVERYCGKTREDGRWRVMAVSRSAGKPFGRVRTLHSGARTSAHDLEIALDAQGGATIAWTREPATGDTFYRDPSLLVSTRGPGGRFSRPQLVDKHADRIQLAAAPTGETVLSWVRLIPRNTSPSERGGFVVAAAHAPATTSFGTPEALARVANRAGRPSLAIAADGTALLSWSKPFEPAEAPDRFRGPNADLEASIRPAGDRFGPAKYIATVPGFDSHTVAIADRSTGYIAWTTVRDPGPSSGSYPGGAYLSRWNGDIVSPATELAREYTYFSEPGILLGRDGTATVEWYQGYNRIPFPCAALPSRFASTVSRDGSPSAPTMVAPERSGASSASALDQHQRPVRAWFEITGYQSDKYGNNCSVTSSRLGGSIAGGPIANGATTKGGPGASALSAAPAAVPLLVWSARGRVLASTFNDLP